MNKKTDPFSLEEQNPRRYLLALVLQDAQRTLEDDIIEAIRPRIRAHVERAFHDLRPYIESVFDPAAKDMALTLTVTARTEENAHAE